MKEIEIVKTDQELYDAFNKFIISDDTKVFGKLLARTLLFNEIKNVPGDIVECGVFKGSGILTLLKLKHFLCPNTHKKIIGFDIFDSEELTHNLTKNDKEMMTALFESRNFKHNTNYKNMLQKSIIDCGFKEHEFELIEGDISITAKKFVEDNPGFKISLLYLDLDLETPTYDTLDAMWDRVSKNGIVVFDEYGYHKWSEAKGVDRFFENKNIELQSLNYICPTVMIRKK